MKIQKLKNELVNSLVNLHGEDWVVKQRIAGRCVADVMILLSNLIQSGKERNCLKLDAIAEKEILARDCTATFKGFKSFPNTVCISVNKELVHGIPKDYELKDGDYVSLDFGATFEGTIADSAKTLCVGSIEDPEMIKVGNDCLYKAIKAMKIGLRTGIIGHTIYRTAKNAGFNVIDRYGGHGISWNRPHADLFIPNKSEIDEGVRIQPGLTIAIEPLLVPGDCSTKTTVCDDGWTVLTENISIHTEQSVYVHKDKIELITWREDMKSFIDKEIYF